MSRGTRSKKKQPLDPENVPIGWGELEEDYGKHS